MYVDAFRVSRSIAESRTDIVPLLPCNDCDNNSKTCLVKHTPHLFKWKYFFVRQSLESLEPRKAHQAAAYLRFLFC